MKEGYKKTEIGWIPVGWKVGTLDNIARIIMGLSPPGDTYNSSGNGIPMLNGPTEFTAKHPIPVQYTTKITKVSEEGDILFCVRGSSTGRMNIADKEYCIGRGLAAIRAKKEGNTNYIHYILQSLADDVLRKAKDMGSTFPNVNSKELCSKPVVIPPLPEQQKIAEILSTVDEKIEVIGEQISKTQELKQGLMQRLLTKGIGHTRFKDSPLGKIPESWEMAKLSEVADINPSRPQDVSADEPVSFIGMVDVSEDAKLTIHHQKTYFEVSKGFTSFQDGDVLVAKITPCFENGKGALPAPLSLALPYKQDL